MGVDMRNIGDVASFLRGVLPFDILPVRAISAEEPRASSSAAMRERAGDEKPENFSQP